MFVIPRVRIPAALAAFAVLIVAWVSPDFENRIKRLFFGQDFKCAIKSRGFTSKMLMIPSSVNVWLKCTAMELVAR